MALPNGYIIIDPPRSGYQLLYTLYILQHNIFYQFLDLLASMIKHLYNFALNKNVAKAICDTGEAVNKNFFVVGQVAKIL